MNVEPSQAEPGVLPDEAERWFARLRAPDCEAAERAAFERWRARPGNAERYRRVERLWEAMAVCEREAIASIPAAPRSRRPFARYAGLAAAALFLAVVGVWFGLSGAPAAQLYSSAYTPRVVRLADGSRITLDAGTTVKVRLERRWRRVDLRRGRALFEVAHDAQRPFLVHAGVGRIEDIGTRFEIARGDGRVQVTLLRGAVRIWQADDRRSARVLSDPGMHASLGGAATQWRLSQVDPAAVIAWTVGRLEFRDTPLNVALRRVNRYLRRPIVLAPGVDGDAPVSGSFRAGDADGFAHAAAAIFGLRIARDELAGGLRLLPEKKSRMTR